MLPDIAQLLAAPAWLLDVLDTSVRVTLLLVAAGVTALVMRRAPAQARHQLWALALGATLILPLAALVLPAWHLSSAQRSAHGFPGQTSPWLGSFQ